MTGIGEILAGGFGVVARRPATLLAWIALQAIPSILTLLLFGPRMMAQIEQLSTIDMSDPVAMQAWSQSSNGMAGLSWLLSLAGYFIIAVILCGAFRTVVRPEEPNVVMLRLGWDEVRIFVVQVVTMFALAILAVIAFLMAMIPFFIVAMVSQNSPAVSIVVGFLLWATVAGGMIYLIVRLSMMLPLTFIYRRLAIDEGWRLAGGRFWTLFGAYFALWLSFAVIATLVVVAAFWVLSAGMPVPPAGELNNAQSMAWLSTMGEHLHRHTIAIGITMLAMLALQTAFYAIAGGAMATAAMGFLRDDGRLPGANPDESDQDI